MIPNSFFAQNTLRVARKLLGKVLRMNQEGLWLSAQIIETEAYIIDEKASHASQGYTEKRKALFMEPGTIYMYYSRGGASLNISCFGRGNAVLIKSGIPYSDSSAAPDMISRMQANNPPRDGKGFRPIERLCSGQTLLCLSLGITVPDWDQKMFDRRKFYLDDIGYRPSQIIQTPRLGIPEGRDADLLYRFIDYQQAIRCTSNPLTKRNWMEGRDYFILDNVENKQ